MNSYTFILYFWLSKRCEKLACTVFLLISIRLNNFYQISEVSCVLLLHTQLIKIFYGFTRLAVDFAGRTYDKARGKNVSMMWLWSAIERCAFNTHSICAQRVNVQCKDIDITYNKWPRTRKRFLCARFRFYVWLMELHLLYFTLLPILVACKYIFATGIFNSVISLLKSLSCISCHWMKQFISRFPVLQRYYKG